MGDDTGDARPDGAGPGAGGTGSWRPVVDPVEPRVLGIPTRWFRPATPLKLGRARHPLRWLAWRREVARLGPYARDFDAFLAERGAEGTSRPQRGR